MIQLQRTLRDGLRILTLRVPRGDPERVRAGTCFALVAFWLAAAAALDALFAPAPRSFNPHAGIEILAASLLLIAAGALLGALAHRRDAVWGLGGALITAALLCSLIITGVEAWIWAHAPEAVSERQMTLLRALAAGWWFLLLAILARNLLPRRPARALLAGVLAWVVSGTLWWWLPDAPLVVSVGLETDLEHELDGGAADGPTFDPEQLMFRQRTLVDDALANLRLPTPGVPDLYAIAFAGDATEPVFANEAAYFERLFSGRFGAEGRVLVLANDTASVARLPLASWTNLHHALEGLAHLIDPGEDLVLLYLTSHGSADHELLVELDPLPLQQIGPQRLAEAFQTHPAIESRVVIVNACYSGGFIDALRNDSTLVITSARADRSSFGCGASADITWFGRALLVEALNRSTSLREAFALAERGIAAREQVEGEEASMPQWSSGPRIDALLERWRATLAERAPVPFTREPNSALAP